MRAQRAGCEHMLPSGRCRKPSALLPCGFGKSLSSGIQRRGRRERKTSSELSTLAQGPLFPPGHPPRWDGLSQMDSSECHTHVTGPTFVNASLCQAQHLPPAREQLSSRVRGLPSCLLSPGLQPPRQQCSASPHHLQE